MKQRVPASMRTRQSLFNLIEGRLSSPDGRAELVKLATRLIVEEALEAESRDALGREYYEHGAGPCQGYRNGVRTGRLRTAEGLAAQIQDGQDRRFGRALSRRAGRAHGCATAPSPTGIANAPIAIGVDEC